MAKKRTNPLKAKLDFLNFRDQDQSPQVAVYLVDKAGKTLETGKVGKDGTFQLSAKGLDGAHRVFIGPQVEEVTREQRAIMVSFRPDHFIKQVEDAGIINLPHKDWGRWLHIKRCIDGSVRQCIRYPWFEAAQAIDTDLLSSRRIATSDSIQNLLNVSVGLDVEARPLEWPIARCRTICDGLVEVYRRVCCCRPWIIYDPRLPELIRDLEDLIPRPWPPVPIPIPDPPPDPFPDLPFLEGGALNKRALNASRDLMAIRSLPPAEVAEYINARSYLLCYCESHEKVGQGFIQPSGDFNICWWEWPRILSHNCHEEYAFVVKQNIDGSTVTIYDGVSANQWFDADDDIDLVSHYWRAITCGEDDIPGEGAFVLLQDIGLTNSWNLKTPDATGWDRVSTPNNYNDGLAFPAANAADALGKYKNRNWGGTLNLRYHFSEDMKGIGAKYYRVSVVAADANGNPTGDRTYLAPNEWKYYEVVFPDILVHKTSLGPLSKGGQNLLYEIPYHSDKEWQSGQYHAILNTSQFDDGRFLLTVEVFNSSGKLIRPTGTPDPGGSVTAGFTYRRWYQETGPTANVPYAALTHMLWWDNRSAEAEIVDFRLGGIANTQECQFLEASGSTTFSVGYRAYHPEPMFLLYHSMWWRRGLGGPTGILTNPHPNPNNVGVPPGLVHVSDHPTLADMLGSHSRCTFSVNLRAYVKTFNGIGTVNHNGADQGSMALGIV